MRRLELELSGLAPCKVGRITEIINQMMGEGQLTFLEKALPSDSLGPFTKTLIFVGIIGIDLDHFLDGFGSLRPAWCFVGYKGNHDLGKLRCADPVGHFATGHDDDAVTLPPAMMTMPSPSVSASGMDGHMV